MHMKMGHVIGINGIGGELNAGKDQIGIELGIIAVNLHIGDISVVPSGRPGIYRHVGIGIAE